MPPELIDQLSARRITFVVGKGGTGKSTTAAAIALSCADAGHETLLLSTDPAPSIVDIFGVQHRSNDPFESPCTGLLTLEELDAERIADAWLDRARAPLEQLIELGTYLAASDIPRLSHLTLPGVDEIAAALRIAQLSGAGARVVIDTAPTGHTLRLLDAASLIDSWVAAFRAMADKADAVALQMAGSRARLPGAATVDEMEGIAAQFRDVLSRASFVVVTRTDPVVQSETARLVKELRTRGHSVAAIITVGESQAIPRDLSPGDVEPAQLEVPQLPDARGCDGLRTWKAMLREVQAAQAVGAVRDADASAREGHADRAVRADRAPASAGSSAAWLRGTRQRVLWFAGKGGVGKSTCAAAVALCLASDRRVLLCSTDPAGSLADVFDRDMPSPDDRVGRNLRVVQVNAAVALEAWRDRHRNEAEGVMDKLGFGGGATLDQAVLSAAWDVVPPGVDELFSLSELLDASAGDETIIVDAAPTGHFLRLLASPAVALDWTHALMRIILNYGAAGKLDGFSERVLAFARQLKHLSVLLTDPAECGVFVVSLPEPVVEAQTDRLIEALRESRVAVAARIVNRVTGVCPDAAGVTFCAPLLTLPPRGVQQLDAFIAQWTLVHE